MPNEFWRDQRVLVTGGRGFLGRQISSNALPVNTIISDYDLRWFDNVHDLYLDIKPTLVIHCAANAGGIGKNRQQSGAMFYDNILMNTHVLHEAFAAGVQKFVGIGSVCAYPKHTPIPFKERDLWNGYPEETNAAYGETKRALLVMSQAYRQQHGFNAIHLLMANLYGPGDRFDLENSHVIPAIIRKMVDAKAQGITHITLWGSGEASREFLYVEDAAKAIVRAAEVYNSGEPLNIGTGQSIRIRDLAKLIAQVVGYRGGIIWDTDMPDGQPKRELDVSRAALELEWVADTSLEDGLQQTVDWYMRERVNV
jgi:GDP-L-fucose synthase